MKTIIAPTDHSEESLHAVDYAAQLAHSLHAKLVLMHVYQLPVPSAETALMMITPQELEEVNLKKIKALEHRIAKLEGLKTESLVRCGFVTDEILSVAKDKKASLVVAGITGDAASRTWLGSHTTALIRQAHVPVLAVPSGAEYTEVKKIVLACNYSEAVNKKGIEKVKRFAQLFDAKLLVLDVEKPVAVPQYENTAAGETLQRALKDVDHALFYSYSEDLAEGINTFADEHNCDWVAMQPHNHTIWDRLFHKSNTKRMAFHTHIPLLSIHD